MYNLKDIINLIKKNNIFLTGGAGVGKTTLTNEIIQYFQKKGKNVARLASTGMAATLLEGQTLHSFFDFGIASNMDELKTTKKLQISRKVKKILSAINLIIVDEISMVSKELFEMIRLRLLQADFKGKVMVVGDFLQLPPVTKTEVKFAFESEAWERFEFKTLSLDKVYRTSNKEFIELLNHIRFGYINEKIHNQLNDFVKPLPNDLREFTFLFGKNKSASYHNHLQLEYIQTQLHVKKAEVMIYEKSITNKEVERFFEDARIDKELYLKVGVPVLFTRNSWNFFNGERGIIIGIDEDILHVRKDNGITVKLSKLKQSKTKWVEKNDKVKEEELFAIYQYPVKLAFAITIHKSQGMSLDDIIIESNEIFSPSQFYVALSRTKNPNRLNLIAPKKQWSDLVFVHQKAVEFYNRLKKEPKI